MRVGIDLGCFSAVFVYSEEIGMKEIFEYIVLQADGFRPRLSICVSALVEDVAWRHNRSIF